MHNALPPSLPPVTPELLKPAAEAALKVPATPAIAGEMGAAKIASTTEAIAPVANAVAGAVVPAVGLLAGAYLMWNGFKMIVTGKNLWKKHG